MKYASLTRMRAAVLAVAVLTSAVLLTGCERKPAGSTEEDVSSPASSDVSISSSEELTFPMMLENGRLTVDSVFQFSGFNPDCGGEQGDDIAALQITNNSVEQLESAQFSLTLNDSTIVNFRISDLPAGASAMIFSTENTSMSADDVCTDLSVEAQFTSDDPLMEDQLSFAVEGATVAVTNHSDQELTNISVYCHSMLDNTSYGGLTYCYPIISLPAGGTVSVDASDCYLGGAMVSRISVN